MKKKIVVICPGRGSYTKETLGYLKQYGEDHKSFLQHLDGRRAQLMEPLITELDSSPQFKVSVHTKGEHASPLIYACSAVDFSSIDREKFEVVAVCGNSMGWYLTLAFGGVLDWDGAFDVIQTMGSMMKDQLIGGQMIYPVVHEDWTPHPELESEVLLLAQKHGAYLSIKLGGYLVIGGAPEALKELMQILPKNGDYPFQLINHGAFHTPLLSPVSERAFELLGSQLFHRPQLPLIDGEGRIWNPFSSDLQALYQYTLGHQVYAPYDFSSSIEVALKEFAPDHLVLLGPGGSLGGSIGQTLVKMKWQGISNKADFQQRQKTDPFLLSMGLPEQRRVLV